MQSSDALLTGDPKSHSSQRMDRRRLQDIAFQAESDDVLVAEGPLVYDKSTNRGW
jgi:hypothetical protein